MREKRGREGEGGVGIREGGGKEDRFHSLLPFLLPLFLEWEEELLEEVLARFWVEAEGCESGDLCLLSLM